MILQESWTQILLLCKNSMCSMCFLHSLEVVALLLVLTWAQLLDQSCSRWKRAGEVWPPMCFFKQPGHKAGRASAWSDWSQQSHGSRALWSLSPCVLSLHSHEAVPPTCLWSQLPCRRWDSQGASLRHCFSVRAFLSESG